ncbi:Hpt domain-containing protein [Pseudobdellovibrio sp. HCB154]|uniref:Hpt domain-containing protein n=1 Tax=Pseudobdellovibrio sp. HCB154 TaxID=3386277 RepID=UPI003917212D
MSQLKSINADVIENLKALGGMDLLAELHSVYIRTSEDLIKEIHAAIAGNDSRTLQEKAHSLKSSSGNMGALQLSQICLQLEKMGEAQKITEAKALVPSLDNEFKTVSLELAEIVKTK